MVLYGAKPGRCHVSLIDRLPVTNPETSPPCAGFFVSGVCLIRCGTNRFWWVIGRDSVGGWLVQVGGHLAAPANSRTSEGLRLVHLPTTSVTTTNHISL